MLAAPDRFAHDPRLRFVTAWCVFVAALCVFVSGCASVPGIGKARAGDYDGLRKILENETLSAGDVRKLAQATLSGEVTRAQDREDRAFVRSLRSCPRPLIGALRERSKTLDGVGGEAALVLVEAGEWRARKGKYLAADDGAWRAVSARQTQRKPAERRAFFTDPDERVRRAALSAALDAQDPEDIPLLLEVSRLDPDPLCRSLAYQTLGQMGGKRVALALVDRFSVAEEQEALFIVDAWGKLPLFSAGGKEQLSRLVNKGDGMSTLSAAGILARDGDESTRNLALTRLTRFMRDGSRDERRLAIRLLPHGLGAMDEELIRATKAEDEEVAVIAWARLLSRDAHKRNAQERLTQWAKTSTSLGYQARAALAASGDADVLPLLKKQALATDPTTRRVAGQGLLRLGAFDAAALLLADKDSEVRRDIACRALALPPRPNVE